MYELLEPWMLLAHLKNFYKDYILNINWFEAVPFFLLCLTILILFSRYKFGKRYSKGVIFASSLYISFIFAITIFRNVGVEYGNIGLSQAFKTYIDLINQPNPSNALEIVLNVILFIPFGIICSRFCPLKYGMLMGALLSTTLELVQLLTGRGLFEVSDIVNNSIGTGLGSLVVYWVRKYKTIKKN